MEAWQAVLGFLGAVVLALSTYHGVKFTARSSRESVARTSDVAAQQSALEAWQALLEPYQREVAELRRIEEGRAKRERDIQVQMNQLNERIDLLTIELGHWKRLAKVIARWATTLRDQVLSLGGQVPATPDELLLIQSIDNDGDEPFTRPKRKP